MLITGAGSLGTRSGLRLGHFAASRWQAGADGALGEIFVGGEGLKRGARPVLATFAPGDARRRMFIVEQRGAIRVIEAGRIAPKPFFTIGDLSDGNEEGLLGLAFAPRFTNR